MHAYKSLNSDQSHISHLAYCILVHKSLKTLSDVSLKWKAYWNLTQLYNLHAISLVMLYTMSDSQLKNAYIIHLWVYPLYLCYHFPQTNSSNSGYTVVSHQEKRQYCLLVILPLRQLCSNPSPTCHCCPPRHRIRIYCPWCCRGNVFLCPCSLRPSSQRLHSTLRRYPRSKCHDKSCTQCCVTRLF